MQEAFKCARVVCWQATCWHEFIMKNHMDFCLVQPFWNLWIWLDQEMDGSNPWHELLNATKLVLEQCIWRKSLLHFFHILCILIEILVLQVQCKPLWICSINIWNDIVYFLADGHNPHLFRIDNATHLSLTLGSIFFSALMNVFRSFWKTLEKVMFFPCILYM